jgi:uncharacterized protein (DUF1810 family)
VRSDHDLQCFVEAPAPVYDDALHILRQGRMCTPYMDFIFPRLAEDARIAGPFAIVSLDEASAYLTDRLLGAHYRECIRALSWLADRTVREVFGERDATKLHASLTLFAEASNYEPLLRIMLDVWFRERVEEETMIRLGADSLPGTDFPPTSMEKQS